MGEAVRVLGLDPGLRATGWGVVVLDGFALSHVANGTVVLDGGLGVAERLVRLAAALEQVLGGQKPQEAAVESSFMHRNAAAALKLGQARGICLLVPARAGLPVREYAPNLVKKSLTGVGHAGKAQLRVMVERLLPGCAIHSEHAADALATAICHAHHRTAMVWDAAGEAGTAGTAGAAVP